MLAILFLRTGHDLLSRLQTVNHVQRLGRRHKSLSETGRKVFPFVSRKNQYFPTYCQTELAGMTRQGDKLQRASFDASGEVQQMFHKIRGLAEQRFAEPSA